MEAVLGLLMGNVTLPFLTDALYVLYDKGCGIWLIHIRKRQSTYVAFLYLHSIWQEYYEIN